MPLHPEVKAAFAAFRAVFAAYRAGDAEGFQAAYEAAALLALRVEEEAGEEEKVGEEEKAEEEVEEEVTFRWQCACGCNEEEPVFLHMKAAHLRGSDASN